MKRFTATLILLLLAGCGGMQLASNPKLAAKDDVSTPTVWYFGDQVTSNWQFTNPLWINKAIAGQTSDQTLALMQTALSQGKPNVVHILVGNEDEIVDPNVQTPITITDLQQIVALAKSDGVFLVVGTTAPGMVGNYGDPHPDEDAYFDAVNQWITENLTNASGVAVADYYTALTGDDGCTDESFCGYGTGLSTTTSTGLLIPSTAGYNLMTPLAQAAIQKCECGGVK